MNGYTDTEVRNSSASDDEQIRRRKKRKLIRVLVILAALLAMVICVRVLQNREEKRKIEENTRQLDAMREVFPKTVEKYFPDYFQLDKLPYREYVGELKPVAEVSSKVERYDYTDEKGRPHYYYRWTDYVTCVIEASDEFLSISMSSIYDFLEAESREGSDAYVRLRDDKLSDYADKMNEDDLSYKGQTLFHNIKTAYLVRTPNHTFRYEGLIIGGHYLSVDGREMRVDTPSYSIPKQETEKKSGSRYGTIFWSPRSSGHSKSSSSDNDPYNVHDYSDAEDFYEDNYDDFDDYEDAEDYYDDNY